jgi:hypothetical protein
LSHPRSSKKRPLASPAEEAAVLAAAGRLSREHYEVVLLLLSTGIELRSLSRLTWREILPDALLWRRARGRGDLRVAVEDPAVAAAAASFAGRPHRSSDQLDRLVRSAFRATRLPQLKAGSAMTLRLTRCAAALRAGQTPERAAASLSLAPALVRALAADLERHGGTPPHDRHEEE